MWKRLCLESCFNENGEYLASIMDQIICDQIMDVKETNFDKKSCKK